METDKLTAIPDEFLDALLGLVDDLDLYDELSQEMQEKVDFYNEMSNKDN